MTELTEREKMKNNPLYKEAEEIVADHREDILQISRAIINGRRYHGELFSN